MLTALQINRQRPRHPGQRIRQRFRRKGRVWSRLVKVPGGHYLLITADENRRGEVDWREIGRIAGNEAGQLLLPTGVTPPPESGIRPFAGQALQQALMLQTALKLLRILPALSRRRIVLHDPQGIHSHLVNELIPLAADLRVVTDNPKAYAPVASAVMEDYGACLPITADPACMAEAALVLAPDGCPPQAPLPRGWVLSGQSIPAPRVITGYIPADAAGFIDTCPPGCDVWQYLAGLYERSRIYPLGESPPLTLFAGDQALSIGDIGWRLAGLDIGLTV